MTYYKQRTTPSADLETIRYEAAQLPPPTDPGGTFADQHGGRSIEIHIIGAGTGGLAVEIGRPGRETMYYPSLTRIHNLQDIIDELLINPEDHAPEITLLSRSIWLTFYNV